MEWKAIAYVTGPITLLAFIGVLIVSLYRSQANKYLDLIRQAPVDERGALVDRTIELYSLNTETLSGPARERIALEQLRLRERRYRNNLIAAVIFALIFASLFVVAVVNENKSSGDKEQSKSNLEDGLPTLDILSVVDEVDLRQRVPVPISDRKTVKRSKAVRLETYDVVKVLGNAQHFMRRLATSGMTPDVSCENYNYTVKELRGDELRKQGVTENLTGYDMAVDISGEPVDKPFKVLLRLVYWNGFQGESGDWTSHNAIYPERLLTFRVIFPRDKPYTTYTLYAFPRLEGTHREAYKDKPEINESLRDGSKVIEWIVRNPKTNYAYRIDWTW